MDVKAVAVDELPAEFSHWIATRWEEPRECQCWDGFRWEETFLSS